MASGYLQLQDFYTAGVGCDLGGAFLLARGLINRPAELTRLAGSFYGSNAYEAISVAKNRLDAVVGVLGLGAGFTLAVVGYLAALATPHTTRTGTPEVLVGAALALFALAVTLAAGHVYRRLRLVPLLIEMARFTMTEERMPFPRAALLPRWLEALGHDRREGEDDLGFVRRAAKVDDLIVDVSQTAAFPYPCTRRASEPPLDGELPG